MHKSRSISKIITKLFAGLIYLSFFLVQFNIHLNGSPNDISFFSSDYSSVKFDRHQESPNQIQKHSTKPPCFRLNKRFHPSSLFTAPPQAMVLIDLNYKIQTPLLNNEQPLTQYSFNSPSLRGPPAFV